MRGFIYISMLIFCFLLIWTAALISWSDRPANGQHPTTSVSEKGEAIGGSSLEQLAALSITLGAPAMPNAASGIALRRMVAQGPTSILRPHRPAEIGRGMPFDRVVNAIARRAAAAAMILSSPKTHQLPETIRFNQRATEMQTLSRPRLSIGHRMSASGVNPLAGCASVYTGNSVKIANLEETGINHWWDDEEDTIPGIGRYMINVATGNLLVQADDMAVPNKGIELAFRRTYNSQSSHDEAGDDGSPDLYGDRWTNTFDVHIAYNDFAQVNCQRGVTVFDIDGAHYDYAPFGDGKTFTNPAGQFAKLSYDGTFYYWTKKTGTQYVFWDINQSSSNVGYSGQIKFIFGRNVNNSLSFVRSWTNGDASTLEHLSAMTVTSEDDRIAALTYGDITGDGQTFRVLQSLTWPDQSTTVTYGYTIGMCLCSNGSWDPVLEEVDEPGNNVASVLEQQYLSEPPSSGPGLLVAAYSPRWVYSSHADGGYLGFTYNTDDQASSVTYNGFINPTITDASGTGAVQPAYASNYGVNSPYRTVSLTYNVPPSPPIGAPTCNATGSSTWSDTDGHESVYCWDNSGRVVQVSDLTGDPTPGPMFLTSTQGWDSDNNLSFVTDQRGNRTDYAYDANGNTVMMAKPSVTTSAGTFRPTSRYTYDSSDNVISYCDPVFTHKVNGDYPNSYSCPTTYSSTSKGPSLFVYSSQNYEPKGELTSMTTFSGYAKTFTYATAPQQGTDYGLPTKVLGTSFTELDGKTVVSPEQDFVYDNHGNVVCYNDGNQGWWVIDYDILSRMTAAGDPDDNFLSSSFCTKTTGQYHTSDSTIYYPNGEIEKTQSPREFSYSVYTSFEYNADGDETAVTHHYDNVAATTDKYYDANGRLVEVIEPLDNRKIKGIPDDYDLYSPDVSCINWTTRYIYDLSAGGTVSVTGSSPFRAYGNLYATKTIPAGCYSGYKFYDSKGTAYDALDRTTSNYFYVPPVNLSSQASALHVAQLVFDTNGNVGLLASRTDGVGTQTTFSYNALSQETAVTFSDATPSRTYLYDPDGRTSQITESPFGTLSYTFDPDGKVAQVTEPSGGGITSPANPLTYSYYPNGWKASVSIVSSGLTQSNLFDYIYRQDGRRTSLTVTQNGKTRNLGWSFTAAGRTVSANDSWLSPAVSYAYTGYGDVDSYALQEGSFSTINYDAEGSPISIATTPYWGSSPEQMHTSLRGEFFWEVYTNNNGGLGSYNYRNGLANGGITTWSGTCINNGGNGQSCSSGRTQTNDQLLEVRISNGVRCFESPANIYTSYSFDADGRQDSTASLISEGLHGQNCVSYGSYTRQYDAENHLIGMNFSNWKNQSCGQLVSSTGSAALVYKWGPNGHPIIISGLNGYSATLHWDGDNLLYTSNNSTGKVDDIKIESLADIAPTDSNYSDLTVWDRMLSGYFIGFHNSTTKPTTNFTGYPPSWYQSNDYLPGGTSNGVSWPTVHFMFNRLDGLADGCNAIQGVRAYSSEVQNWTSPDAFAGDVNDPASQVSYMWNRDNPVVYNDPSGFWTEDTKSDGDFLDAFNKVGVKSTAEAYLNTSNSTLTLSFQDKNGNTYKRTFTVGLRSARPFSVKDLEKNGLFLGQLGESGFFVKGTYILGNDNSPDAAIGWASTPIVSQKGANSLIDTSDGSLHSDVMIHGGRGRDPWAPYNTSAPFPETEGCVRACNMDAWTTAVFVRNAGGHIPFMIYDGR